MSISLHKYDGRLSIIVNDLNMKVVSEELLNKLITYSLPLPKFLCGRFVVDSNKVPTSWYSMCLLHKVQVTTTKAL